MAGRPPKTEEQHRRDGTYQPCRHGGSDPARGKPRRPDWLDDDAGWLWDVLTENMVGHKAPDSPLIAGLCRWWSLWRKWDRALEHGSIDAYKGAIMASMAWKNVLATSTKLGISITDRMKLRHIGEAGEPKDEKSGFLGMVG